MSFAEDLAKFREAHPEVTAAEVFLVDLNGQSRGKRVPLEMLEKLAQGGMKMPVSSYALDIFSEDVAGAKISLERGDPDGVLIPVPGTLGLLPWAQSPTAQVQVQITSEDGQSDCEFDPRWVLSRVAAEASSRGFTPVMALELEFYLIDPAEPLPPLDPRSGTRLSEAQIYKMDLTNSFATILDEIGAAARALGAPADTVIAEFGPGQFEMNLSHVACPVTAADHMVTLKRAIRGVARKHGMDASFMPKPYGDQSGSGMHLHMSLLDETGENLFSTPKGVGDTARWAAGGMIETMAEFMLAFAPHPNSYRRLAPGTFAPIVAAWGLDNRGTALRMPATQGKAARIEHRTAGSDANPYLVAAAVLAGALHGIETQAEPPAPVVGEAGAEHGLPLPLSWWASEQRFAASETVRHWFGPELRRIFTAQKRQERAGFLARVPNTEYALYLRSF
ncbi:MAG: glutamine synthetase family protein [Pseudomonadota bacterium]